MSLYVISDGIVDKRLRADVYNNKKNDLPINKPKEKIQNKRQNIANKKHDLLYS